jgi:hypothetical protein
MSIIAGFTCHRNNEIANERSLSPLSTTYRFGQLHVKLKLESTEDTAATE